MTQTHILELADMHSRRAQFRRGIATALCILIGGAVVSWLLLVATDAASAMLAGR